MEKRTINNPAIGKMYLIIFLLRLIPFSLFYQQTFLLGAIPLRSV